jgi:hypothetical protein
VAEITLRMEEKNDDVQYLFVNHMILSTQIEIPNYVIETSYQP